VPGTANAALACGILSLLSSCCCCVFSMPLSIAAIVCGIMALNVIKTEPDRYGGKSQAITGIALGSVGIVMALIGLVIGIAGNILEAAKSGHF
jgi:hypothetical protein